MKLSTRGRYGVRLMVDLAVHESESPILLKDIAARQEISEKYLWQLISPLQKAGLIDSIRGARGGYKLAKSPKDITLKDVIVILEGSMCIVACVDNAEMCNRSGVCVTRDVWEEISKKVMGVLEAVSLLDMVKKYKTKNKTITYCI